MMDHKRLTIPVDGAILSFYGVQPVRLEYVESTRTPEFAAKWYRDEEGTVTEIIVIEVEPSNEDGGTGTGYAQIEIKGEIRAELEIWDGPNGRIYY